MWGATTQMSAKELVAYIFQSTLPVWGATICMIFPIMQLSDFNPHSPCGERRYARPGVQEPDRFQSTLPVWGATSGRAAAEKSSRFQSTLPVWGATRPKNHAPQNFFDFNPHSPCGERRQEHFIQKRNNVISIHTPRVGSDRTG